MEINRNFYKELVLLKNRISVWSSNSIFRQIQKRIESRVSKWLFVHHIHSNIIHNSREIEGIQMCIKGLMSEKNVMCVCEYYASFKKKENSDTYYIDEPCKPVTKRWLQCDSIYMRHTKQSNPCQHSRVTFRGYGNGKMSCLMGTRVLVLQKWKRFWRLIAPQHE